MASEYVLKEDEDFGPEYFKEDRMTTLEVGGIRATLCHRKFRRRSLFAKCLSLVQAFMLWYEHRDIPKIIRKIAARVTHVQIDVGEMPITDKHLFANQTAPQFLISFWGPSDFGVFKRLEFIFLKPAFILTKQIKTYLLEYAIAVVRDPGRLLYDFLQLFSFLVNILIWLARDLQIWIGGIFPAYDFMPDMAFDDRPYPSDSLGGQINKLDSAKCRFVDEVGKMLGREKSRLWGKEVIKAFNIPGNKEVCSTLVRAVVEYALAIRPELLGNLPPKIRTRGVAPLWKDRDAYRKARKDYPQAFRLNLLDEYDIAMTTPATLVVCGLWVLEYSDEKYELIRYYRDCTEGYPFALKNRDGTGIADAYPEKFDSN